MRDLFAMSVSRRPTVSKIHHNGVTLKSALQVTAGH